MSKIGVGGVKLAMTERGAPGGIPVTRVSNGIGGKAEFDTLGKTVTAHRAGAPTAHEWWVPHLRWVEGARGKGRVCPSHPPQMSDFPLICSG